MHLLFVGIINPSGQTMHPSTTWWLNVASGAYTITSPWTGTYEISAVYNHGTVPNWAGPTDNPDYVPVPGERFLSGGSCGNPAAPATYPVTFVSGMAVGPDLVIDDSCSYQGFYGTLSYTGVLGIVQHCRKIRLETFSDAGFNSPLSMGATVAVNNGSYNIVTNLTASGTGLSPLYLRIWFDANGDNVFNTGDPYSETGPYSPTNDGLNVNVTFGDTYIK